MILATLVLTSAAQASTASDDAAPREANAVVGGLDTGAWTITDSGATITDCPRP